VRRIVARHREGFAQDQPKFPRVEGRLYIGELKKGDRSVRSGSDIDGSPTGGSFLAQRGLAPRVWVQPR